MFRLGLSEILIFPMRHQIRLVHACSTWRNNPRALMSYHSLPTEGRFPPTDWSLLGSVDGDAEQRKETLGRVLFRYMPALTAHLLTRRGLSKDAAEELVQDFVCEKVLADDLIAKASPRRGRFRHFLVAALEHHVVSRWRFNAARKRRPATLSSLDSAGEPAAPSPGGKQSDVFDEAWARQVLAETLDRLKAHCSELAKHDVWGVFEARILLPALTGSAPVGYARLVKQYGFATPVQAANAAITARRMFARFLRAVVSQYVSDESAVDEEIRDLRRILARGTARSMPGFDE